MISCKLDLEDYVPHIAAEFCDFQADGIYTLVPQLRAKIRFLQQSLILKQEEIQVSLDFIDIASIPKVDSDNLIRFVRGQAGLLCRFHLRANLIAEETLLHLQNLVDEAFLLALSSHLQPNRKQAPFALKSLFAEVYPPPSLTKVIESGPASLQAYSPPEQSLRLPALRRFNLALPPHGLLLDYDNFNHPEFQNWKNILKLLSKSMISLIAYHLGKDGLKHLCQTLEMIAFADLNALIDIFFTGADETKLFLLALPSGEKYLDAWLSWSPEIRVCFLAWARDAQQPFDFFAAIAKMQTFWQELKPFCPKPASPKTRFKDLNFFSHLDTLSALINLVAKPYQQMQVNALFELNYRPLTVYQKRMELTQAKWVCEAMFNSSLESPQALEQVLVEPCEATFFQYASQYLQDYSSMGHQVFAYADAVAALKSEQQPFAWSFAAWVSGSFELMTTEEFTNIYHSLSILEDPDSLLSLLFSIPALYRPNSKQMQALLDLAQTDKLLLRQLIAFYAGWHTTMTRAYVDTWPLLFNLLGACPRVQLPHILTPDWTQSFNLIYARSLFFIFALSPAEVEQALTDFAGLNPGQQVEFSAILVSMKLPWQPLPAHELILILQAGQTANTSFLALFSQYLPQFNFHYFETMVDYDLVLERMDRLLKSVSISLDFFLGDESFMRLVPKVKTLLKKDAIAELQTQQAHLALVEAELKTLRDLRQNLDLSHLFHLFKQFDSFFVTFVEHQLDQIFEPLLFTFLGRLDANLKKTNRLKQLMTMVLAQHDKIASTRLGQHLKPEMLKILVEETHLPLMQRFLQKFLVDDLMQTMAFELEDKLQSSLVPIQLRQQLSSFLHRLPLDVVALNHFFLRYQGILKVIQQWPQLEKSLVSLNLHPELAIDVWKLCLESQFVDGEIYFSGHWHLVLQVLKRLIVLFQQQVQPKFSFLSFLQSFFKATDVIAQFEVLGDGSLAHPNLELMWTSLEEAIAHYGHQSLWLNLLPQALATIINHGHAFNFAKSLEIFSSLNHHPQLHMQLLNLEGQALEIQVFLDDVRRILALPLTYRPILDKLLQGLAIDTQLSAFHLAISWLLAEDNYPWFEMILDDTDFCFADLAQLINLLQAESAWARAYQLITKPVEAEPSLLIKEKEEEPPPVKPWWKIWTGLWKTEQPLSQNVRVDAPPDLHLQIAHDAWKTFAQAPYPRFVQLNAWLSVLPSQSLGAIEHFDAFPLGQTEAYSFAQADFKRWLDELTVYVGASLDQAKMEWQLKSILALFNRNLHDSRRHLVEKFKAIVPAVRQQQYDLGLINQLLALISALYCKSTGRRPYPTQLITLMVYLEFSHKNVIFEVDTGEGKGITTALLAVLKWALREQVMIEILTANRDLVKQDYQIKGHWRFFQLLGIPHRIIEEDSAFSAYPEQGIVYTTQDDIAVFKALQQVETGIQLEHPVEAIIDEVDHSVLDQNRVINLAIKSKDALDWTELYVCINQFVDRHWLETDKRTWAVWIEALKMVVFDYYDGNHYRQALLTGFSAEKWQLWLELAVYTKYLRENEDFIVEARELASGQIIYQALPYLQSDIKYGFDLSYKSKSGLKQFLHARLNSPQRPFTLEAEPILLTQISPNYLAQLNSFVGLTGSFGSISECRELKESLFANLIRIPRYFPSRLEEGPILMLANIRFSLEQMLKTEVNPVLICVPGIEAAHHLYQTLFPYFLDRPLCLLTGQESQWVRQRWLQNQAGQVGAITIATLICGRGTDISVPSPHFLKILQLGILEPRHTMQLKGRTARNNNQGYYQLVLEGHPSTRVEKLIDAKQHEMILNTRKQRLLLRMKTWLARYIFEILASNLKQLQLPLDIQNYLYFYVSAALADLSVSDPFNPKSYFEPAKNILQTLLAKLILLGPIHLADYEERLMDSLNADKDRWSTIIPPVFLPLSAAEPFQISDFQFQNLEYSLIVLQIQAQLPMKKARHLFGWLYRVPPLEALSLKILEEAWNSFRQDPQLETWEIFYSSLLTAQILYQILAKNIFFARNYSSLLPWVKVLAEIQQTVELFKVLEQESLGFFNYLASQLQQYQSENLPSLWTILLLKIFQPDFYLAWTQTQNCLQKFTQISNANHLADLQRQALEFSKIYTEVTQSWWRGWWYRWACQSFCQPHLDLNQRVQQLIEQYAKQAYPHQHWRDLQQSIACHQLAYRQRILQEQIPQVSRFSVWSAPSLLSPRVVFRAEMDELARLFSKEIYELYAKFYQLSSQDFSQQPKRWVLLAVLRAYFNPVNPKLSLDLMGEEFKVLLGEFDRWSNSRQLLLEWEEMNPSLA